MSNEEYTSGQIRHLLYTQLSTLDLYRKLSNDSSSAVIRQIIDCKSSRMLDFSNQLKKALIMSGENIVISIRVHHPVDSMYGAIELMAKQEQDLAFRYSRVLKCQQISPDLFNLLSVQYASMNQSILNSSALIAEVA